MLLPVAPGGGRGKGRRRGLGAPEPLPRLLRQPKGSRRGDGLARVPQSGGGDHPLPRVKIRCSGLGAGSLRERGRGPRRRWVELELPSPLEELWGLSCVRNVCTTVGGDGGVGRTYLVASVFLVDGMRWWTRPRRPVGGSWWTHRHTHTFSHAHTHTHVHKRTHTTEEGGRCLAATTASHRRREGLTRTIGLEIYMRGQPAPTASVRAEVGKTPTRIKAYPKPRRKTLRI